MSSMQFRSFSVSLTAAVAVACLPLRATAQIGYAMGSILDTGIEHDCARARARAAGDD